MHHPSDPTIPIADDETERDRIPLVPDKRIDPDEPDALDDDAAAPDAKPQAGQAPG